MKLAKSVAFSLVFLHVTFSWAAELPAEHSREEPELRVYQLESKGRRSVVTTTLNRPAASASEESGTYRQACAQNEITVGRYSTGRAMMIHPKMVGDLEVVTLDLSHSVLEKLETVSSGGCTLDLPTITKTAGLWTFSLGVGKSMAVNGPEGKVKLTRIQ